MTHSIHFIYGYMASDMIKDHSAREETSCCHIGASLSDYEQEFFYMHHPIEDNTYQGLCYTSRGTLDGMRNSPMGSP